MRVPIRTSRLAKWSRRLGGFAVPLVVLTLILRLLGLVEPDVFEICIALATVLGLLAVVLGVCGYVRLWFSGDKGWGAASFGACAGLIALVPAGYAAAMISLYPATVDIVTDPADPPRLLFAEPDPEGPSDAAEMLAAYPNLLSRFYQVEVATLLALAEEEATRMGWQIADAGAVSGLGANARLNARRESLFGWPGEIAMRIDGGTIGSRINLRAASIRAIHHDLGENGRALEAFLVALDNRVTTYMQENLPVDEDEDLPEVIVDDPEVSEPLSQ